MINDYKDLPVQLLDDEPIITAHDVINWVRNALAGVGILALIVALGFWSAV